MSKYLALIVMKRCHFYAAKTCKFNIYDCLCLYPYLPKVIVHMIGEYVNWDNLIDLNDMLLYLDSIGSKYTGFQTQMDQSMIR